MLNITTTVQLTEEDIKNLVINHIEAMGYNVVGDIEFKMDYTTEKIGGGRFDLKHRKAVLGITPIAIRPAQVETPKITAPSTNGR